MNTKLSAAFALGAFLLAGAAHARDIKPVEGLQTDLGNTSLMAYYVQTDAGFEVVTTVMTKGDGAPSIVRFTSVLHDGERTVVSVPAPLGAAPVELIMQRVGDHISATTGTRG